MEMTKFEQLFIAVLQSHIGTDINNIADLEYKTKSTISLIMSKRMRLYSQIAHEAMLELSRYQCFECKGLGGTHAQYCLSKHELHTT